MRLIAVLSLVAMIFTIVGCAPSAAPAPTSAPAPTNAPAAAAPVQAPTAAATVSPVQGLAPGAPSAGAKTVQVQADDNFFRPEKLSITAGTQVVWTNVGQKKHTVTYGNLFDADIKPGETFSYTFDQPGTYQYYCVTHSESDTDGMVGTITVTAP